MLFISLINQSKVITIIFNLNFKKLFTLKMRNLMIYEKKIPIEGFLPKLQNGAFFTNPVEPSSFCALGTQFKNLSLCSSMRKGREGIRGVSSGGSHGYTNITDFLYKIVFK